MKKTKEHKALSYTIPADVPTDKVEKFKKIFQIVTQDTGRLMLFAGDQKVEHMNNDFYGKGIAEDDASPVHLFEIASRANIGVFASQMGLISRYGGQFSGIPYLVKMNSKTNLVPFKQNDPDSRAWYDVEQVICFARNARLKIMGLGYTVYLGSNYEAEMLREAAQIVHKAHLNGLLAVLWIYPKGKVIKDEHDVSLIAGAAGVGACLGADFVKLKVPYQDGKYDIGMLHEIVSAAGNTGVLCEGGAKVKEEDFLQELYEQIHDGGTRGSGTGRNIHQRDLNEAVKMANAIHAITVEGKTVAEAVKRFEN
jgi:class I fructose-bisphosphate aldolase/fructose-bisphosphate aldolase/6-deoxy-5-ketofructose 1-phosphate synthase